MTLKHVDFDAAGLYFCEVSLESPIFTKASNEEQVHVIRKYWLLSSLSALFSLTHCLLLTHRHFTHPLVLSLFCSVPQNAPPTIVFKKRQFYIGEKLVANCTTSRSKPVAHITWLINGKKVNIWIAMFTNLFMSSSPRPSTCSNCFDEYSLPSTKEERYLISIRDNGRSNELILFEDSTSDAQKIFHRDKAGKSLPLRRLHWK